MGFGGEDNEKVLVLLLFFFLSSDDEEYPLAVCACGMWKQGEERLTTEKANQEVMGGQKQG